MRRASRRSLAVATPLPLFLPDGLALAVGAEPERPMRLADLRRGRLRGAAAARPRRSLAALRRERGGSATFTLVDGVPVRLGFSLIGYLGSELRARRGAR